MTAGSEVIMRPPTTLLKARIILNLASLLVSEVGAGKGLGKSSFHPSGRMDGDLLDSSECSFNSDVSGRILDRCWFFW